MNLAAVIALALAVSPADSQRAARLGHRSIIEYNARDFGKALDDAKAAYELDPRPALLFNLGQCYRALGFYSEARFSYRAFLREQPDAPNKALVLDLIKQMEAKLQPEAPPPPAVTPPPPAAAAAPPPSQPIIVTIAPPINPPEAAPPEAFKEEAPRKGIPAAFWGLGGSALAVGAAGTILGVVSSSALAADSVHSLDGYQLHTIPASQYQTAQNEGLAADILWGLGGALLVSAVIVLLTK